MLTRRCGAAASGQHQRTSVASPCRPSLRRVTFTSIIAHGRAGAQPISGYVLTGDARCQPESFAPPGPLIRLVERATALCLTCRSFSRSGGRLLARHFFPTLWRRCRRLDVVLLQPFAHRLPHALVVEPEPSLALRRVLRQHVLEPPERAAAVERDLAIPESLTPHDVTAAHASAHAPRFMHSTSNTYLGLSKATRLVSSPMMVPRAASLDSFTGTPRAAPIRA